MRPHALILPVLVLAALLVVPSPARGLTDAGSLKPVIEILKEDRYLDGEHPAQDARRQFLVYAKSGERAQEVLQVVVRRRQQAQQFFQTSVIWREPAIVLVFPSKVTYLRSTGLYGTAGAQTQFRYRGTGVKIKLVVAYEDTDLIDNTLPHELMHLLMTDMSNRGYYGGRRADVTLLPIWTQEGVAEFMTASAMRRGNFERLAYWALHEERMIGLERLLRLVDYERRQMLHYAESYSFISFIAATVPNGRQRLRNFITAFDDPDRAKDPLRTFELAFQGVAPSIEVLEQRWYAWIKQQYLHQFPPVVVKTFPAHKSEDASTEGKIYLKFDQPMDGRTLTAKTAALHEGTADTLGDDGRNLLAKAKVQWSNDGTVALIEVPGGLRAGGTYTLVLSNHVKDVEQHGLAAEKFAIMETDDWWEESEAESTPNTAARRKAAPKVVNTLRFKTKAGGSADADGSD